MFPRFRGSRQRIPRWLSLIVLLVLLAGCSKSPDDTRGTRVAASGIVMMDEQPLRCARIQFETDQGSGTVRAMALIEDGEFSFDEQNGPLVGEARVEVRSAEMELAELEAARGGDPTVFVNPIKVWIPPKYNTNSTLTANVSDNPDNNRFEFRLVSK